MQNAKRMNKKNFTLIELIAVIVILGIISAVAIPKYINLQNEAADATAKGVFGACQSACALNYAKGAVGAADHVVISTGENLLKALAQTPAGWSNDGTTIKAEINGTDYIINIETIEVKGDNEDEGTMAVLKLYKGSVDAANEL